MSKADQIFIENCEYILGHGYDETGTDVRPRWEDGQSAYTIKQFGLVNRYNLAEEFPILTLRPINIKAAIDELLWIWQKKSNRIDDLNSHIWDSWAGPDGTIGKAYGYQLAQKAIYKEGEFDQVDRLLFDLKHNPTSRRMMTNMFNHHDLHAMQLYPCAYSLTLNVSGNQLNAILNQRSQDMLVANSWNVTQYAVLVHMFAQVSGLQVGELVHVIADAHIYDRHVPLVRDLISRQGFDAPKLIIDPTISDYYQFTVDSFKLENYQTGDKMTKIPVAV
ncbi:MAG: thymidylate synthase [Eubacteriales bacterium]|nr:thymidylate synthase [Eubacteriales bacterium]